MALLRTFTFRGHAAEYLTLLAVEEYSHAERKLSAVFALFKNAATYSAYVATGDVNEYGPTVERAVRLRLSGDRFDLWVGKKALAGPPARDLTQQLYLAAKAEPVDYWGGTLPNLGDAGDA